MTPFEHFPDWLLRVTGLVSLAAIVALWGLRRIRSPIFHRAACVAILLQGAMWYRWEVPVLPARNTAERSFSESTPVENHTQRADVAVNTQLIDEAIRAFEQSPDRAAVPVHEPADISPALQWTKPQFDWRFWFTATWIGGMLLMVIVWVVRYIMFQRRLPLIEEPDEIHRREWSDVRGLAGLRSSIPLWGLAGWGPACGWMKRRLVVFVPSERWSHFTSNQRRAVLLHEAAHLKRGDLWKSLFVRVLALPQWFNPLAWRLVRRFDEAAEWACDEFLLRHQGSCAPEFAEALLSLTVQKSKRPQFTAAAVGHPLSERMRRLLSPTKPERAMFKTTLLVTALALCTTINLVRLSAQEPEQDPADIVPSESPASLDADFDPIQDVPSSVTVPAGDSEPNSFDAHNNRIPFDNPVEIAADPLVSDVLSDVPSTTNLPSEFSDFSSSGNSLDELGAWIADAPVADPAAGRANYAVGSMPDVFVEGEAVIDLSEVFRGSHYFQRETERIKADLAAVEQQIAIARDDARELMLNSTEENEDHVSHEYIELSNQIEQMSSEANRQVQQAEAEVYLTTYRRVRDVIADYARENDIHTVRRVSTPVTEGEMTAEAVLEWINRDIVYSADEPLDITEDIIERLNAADPQTQLQPAMTPYYTPAYPGTQPSPAYTSPYSDPISPYSGTPLPPDATLIPSLPQTTPYEPPASGSPPLPESVNPSVLPPA